MGTTPVTCQVDFSPQEDFCSFFYWQWAGVKIFGAPWKASSMLLKIILQSRGHLDTRVAKTNTARLVINWKRDLSRFQWNAFSGFCLNVSYIARDEEYVRNLQIMSTPTIIRGGHLAIAEHFQGTHPLQLLFKTCYILESCLGFLTTERNCGWRKMRRLWRGPRYLTSR